MGPSSTSSGRRYGSAKHSATRTSASCRTSPIGALGMHDRGEDGTGLGVPEKVGGFSAQPH